MPKKRRSKSKKKRTPSRARGVDETLAAFAMERNLDTERLLLAAKRLIEDRDFGSDEEMQEFLGAHIVGRLPEELFPDESRPNEVARELSLQAMEVDNVWEQVLLAAQSLELDPDNLDARRIRIALSCSREDEKADRLDRALDDYRTRALGRGVDQAELGSDVEHRPYLRTLAELGALLCHIGRLDEARATLEELIDLDGTDSYGAADHLLAAYLELGKVESAASTMERFRDTIKPSLAAWATVLLRHLAGDLEGAQHAHARARLRCAHVGSLITGRKAARDLDRTCETDLEAMTCAADLYGAWSAHPDAMAWLASQRF